MGHKNIALCIVLVLTSSCAIGMRTNDAYASDVTGTVKSFDGADGQSSDAGKVAGKDAKPPKVLRTNETWALFAAPYSEVVHGDNTGTALEKRVPFAEDGQTEVVGSPFGVGGISDPYLAGSLLYMQSQMSAPNNTPSSAPQTSPAELQKLSQDVKDAHDASVLNLKDISELRTDVDDHEERICKKEGKDCKKKPAKRPE